MTDWPGRRADKQASTLLKVPFLLGYCVQAAELSAIDTAELPTGTFRCWGEEHTSGSSREEGEAVLLLSRTLGRRSRHGQCWAGLDGGSGGCKGDRCLVPGGLTCSEGSLSSRK